MAGLSDTLINTLFDGRYRINRKLGAPPASVTGGVPRRAGNQGAFSQPRWA